MMVYVDTSALFAAEALLTTRKRGPSLVDCTSFAVMRFLGIDRAFVFDKHFKQEGFASMTSG